MYANYNNSIENVAQWIIYNSRAIRILASIVEKKTQLPIDTTSIFVWKWNNCNTFLMKNNYNRINQTHLYNNLKFIRDSGIICVMRNICNVNLDTHSRSPTCRFRTLIFKSLIKLRTVVFIEKLNIYIFVAQNNYY